MNLASATALASAREKFFSGHVPPEGLVPPPILRSWQRCAEQYVALYLRLLQQD